MADDDLKEDITLPPNDRDKALKAVLDQVIYRNRYRRRLTEFVINGDTITLTFRKIASPG